MAVTTREPNKELLALIVAQEGKAQATLAKLLTLLLNYRYGFGVDTASDFIQAAGAIRRNGRRIRCVFVIQNKTVSARTTVPALTLGRTSPLFMLLPGHEANDQHESVEGMDTVHVCAWEMAFASGEGSLQRILGEALSEVNLESMLNEDSDSLEQRVKDRLDRLDTLPTLPSIIMHIMHIVSDPRATVAQMEELLMRDTAIVLKVMQVANSPYFHGNRAKRPALDVAGSGRTPRCQESGGHCSADRPDQHLRPPRRQQLRHAAVLDALGSCRHDR